MNRKSPTLASTASRVGAPRRAVRMLPALLLPSLLLATSCQRPAPPEAEPSILSRQAVPGEVRENIDALFSDREAMGETRALIVMKDGKLIHEAYGPGFGPDSRLLGWSLSKSITAVLIGFLVADGRLALDRPAPVAAWQRPGDPRGAITLRHLLHMASGLDHREGLDPGSDAVAMLLGEGAQDMAAWAEAKPPVARPDEQFQYSSATSTILSDILARALTDSDVPAVRRQAVRAFVAGRLADPLGMDGLTPEFDARGTMIGGMMMHATARDYAAFGEFLRRRGVTKSGTRLLADRWFDFMFAPSPAEQAYGAHIWLNRAAGRGEWGMAGPEDIVAAVGHQGQFIVISPRQRITIVRLGVSSREQMDNVRRALQGVMRGL